MITQTDNQKTDSEFNSWEDFMLDRISAARDNTGVESAKGGNLKAFKQFGSKLLAF